MKLFKNFTDIETRTEIEVEPKNVEIILNAEERTNIHNEMRRLQEMMSYQKR